MFDSTRRVFRARLHEVRERGASAVEYGLLIAGIAAVIVVAVMALGPKVAEKFDNTCKAINSNTNCTPAPAGDND